MHQRKNVLFWTTAAAIGSSTQAWISPLHTSTGVRGLTVPNPPMGANVDSPIFRQQRQQYVYHPTTTRSYSRETTRAFFSSSDNDKEEGGGFLSKIGKAVKSVLPKKIFGSEKEKLQIQRRQEMKNELKGNMDEILKGAPLGVRMMGKMISPLISNMASSLAETVAEQQKTTEAMMNDARGYLMRDPAVTRLLGEPISLGSPFSQSSSTSSINGQTQTRVELAMPVSGPNGSGIARMLATQDGIAQLQVEAAGRRLDVSLTKRSPSSSAGRFGSSGSSSSSADPDIIEAEIIEKDTKK